MEEMLRDLAANHRDLLQSLAQSCQALGWTPYILADSSAETIWPPQPEYQDMLKTAQGMDERAAPAGWCIVPVHTGPDRLEGFIGLRAPDAAAATATLAAHAALLEQILAHEQELEDMATELMSAYDQLVALYRVSEITRSNLDLDSLLGALLKEAVQLSEAKHGFVVLQRDTGLQCIKYAWSHPQCETLAQLLFQGIRQWGHDLICNTPSNLGTVLPDAPAAGERCLVTPVRVNGEIVAALGLLDKATPFTAGDRKLMTALTDETSGIIERARLQNQLVAQERMRRELEIAAEIQTGLLPMVPLEVPGLDLAARSIPANEVGGDFYDFISADGRPVAVVLGDVTSKGVPAALFVTVAHTILKSNFAYAGTPRALLERLNAAMYDELTQSAMFVTLFIVYYDPSKRQLVTVNAGHSPVLFYRARTKRCQLLEADGPPVGVLPDILSADQVIDIEPGDVLVIMSDGFNETMAPSGEMFGIERLERLLEKEAFQCAREIQRACFEAVAAFAQGTPPLDDLTICVLKATPRQEPLPV